MMIIPSQSFFCFFASLILYTLASPTFQRDALLEFKKEFPIGVPDPNPFVVSPLSSWNTSSGDYCSWEGVTCDANSGKVISLVLRWISFNGSLKSNSSLFKLQHLHHLHLVYCDLRGEIPSSLGNLSHLIELDLSSNSLVGKIPLSIGNLKQLSALSLGSNHLIGKIPSSLGNLSHLVYLNLLYNHLVGEVPSSVGNLNQLILLELSGNNLSGNIPVSFANLKKLSVLDLSQNQFSGGDFPRILSNLTNLSSLTLTNNHFNSPLPEVNGLHKLKHFDAGGNSFFGKIPTSLFKIHSLRELYLQENQLEGTLEIDSTTSGFSNLMYLYLSHNSLIGPIPESLSKIVSLYSLDLSYNRLEGQIPSFLWRLSSLKLSHNSFTSLEKPLQVILNGSHFDLGSNSLQGVFPRWICCLRSATFLDLSNNHLIGSIPSCLINSISSLIFMNLKNNNMSGSLPDIFINATKLQSLDVSRNQLVGKLPKSLINCNNVGILNLKGNKIKDTFPFWLKSLGSLRVLLLGSNAFYGPIYRPSTDFGFPTLRIIDISHNSFNGTLPQDYFVNWLEMSSVGINVTIVNPYSVYMGTVYGYQDSMDMNYKGVETDFSRIYLGFKAIDFSGNKFEGWIPKSIGLLKDLRLLNLSGNAFTGNIPTSLANITYLEALDLSRNNLAGHIPRDLGNLSFVSYFDFSHNLLEGPVPRGTQFQRQNCSSFEDNLGLVGLEDICGNNHVPDATPSQSQQPEDFSYESEQVVNRIAAAIAYVPGVLCGLVIGHIFIRGQPRTRWSRGYMWK
ncbi:unnamed protein product [Microthlaspi erraticum]|uniref:Uncharacterized protein n=1 Tax=Microthlaspi erraticum TaxID=1685480 RepID=A0A6D2L0J6_9BRAS|nr:unnamed protein product [Microthlaspi erraticum]